MTTEPMAAQRPSISDYALVTVGDERSTRYKVTVHFDRDLTEAEFEEVWQGMQAVAGGRGLAAVHFRWASTPEAQGVTADEVVAAVQALQGVLASLEESEADRERREAVAHAAEVKARLHAQLDSLIKGQ